MIHVEKAEVVLERMVMTNVTVPVPEPVKTKAQLKAEAKEVRLANLRLHLLNALVISFQCVQPCSSTIHPSVTRELGDAFALLWIRAAVH